MIYSDIIGPHRFEIIENKCLVWSSDYETAVFPLDCTIHPGAKHVWFQSKDPNTNKKWILKFELKYSNSKQSLFWLKHQITGDQYLHRVKSEQEEYKHRWILEEVCSENEVSTANVLFENSLPFGQKSVFNIAH